MPQAQRSRSPLVGRPGHNAGETYPPEPLTRSEFADLMRAFRGGPTGARNRAMVTTMYRAGLRLAEVLALRAHDVDVKQGTINVRKGKGKRQRVVGIDDGALAIIERWMTQRKAKGIPSSAPLFCQMDGSPLAPSAVRRVLKTAAARAGITKRVHPHGLRHTYAAELAREGFPVNAIQRSLGHANLAVTSIYLDHLSPSDVIAVGRARTWELD